jgi:DNA-binding response OmpR family regulator
VAVPIIAITDDRDASEKTLRQGFDSYITRPVNLSSLTSRILHLLERETRH